jgi:bla regulator protein BlaR1
MEELAKVLTWTFIHSLWQGLLAALLSAVIISCTRNAAARLRYNLLGMVMILFFAGSITTFIVQSNVETKPITGSFDHNPGDVVMNSTVGLMDRFTAWVNANSDIVVLIWFFFFVFSFLRLATGIIAVNRMRHYKAHSVTTGWKEKLEQLQLVIGVRHSVDLLQSGLIKVPMALGIFKPVILLPLGLLTNLPPEQVETILLHELAHIRRKDYLVNLIQHIIEAIFFFNPAIRWVSFLMRQEREACCDDMVMANCKQKTNYLHALVNFQEYSFDHGSIYAMGISGKRHYLLNRVKRMITNKNKGINFFERIALLSSVLLFSAFGFVTKETGLKSDAGKIQQQALPVVLDQATNQPIQKETIKTLNKPVTDTFPLKKKPGRTSKKNIDDKPVKKPDDQEQTAMDAKATLQEIIKMKDHIGVRKERIGVLKEKLIKTDGQEKERILKELKRERDELDKKREELDIKREQWDKLKEKVKEAQAEQRHSVAKKPVDHQKVPTIKNNDSNQADKTIGLSKKVQYVKSAQWDKSDDLDEDDRKKLKVKTDRGTKISKPKNVDVDNIKLNQQEFEYKMSVPRKDPPPVKEALQGSPIKPGTLSRKAKPVRT